MSIADEIIVLDSFSTDKTQEIAKQYNAKFYQHPFDGHIQQKNRAITYASNNFILSLDADEMLSPQLRQLIAKEKEIGTQDGYTMNRLNFYEGKPIKTCGLYPDKKLRLWDASKGKWEGRNPHDMFVLAQNSSVSHLNADILHNTWPTKAAFLKQCKNFAAISAQHLSAEYPAYRLLFKSITHSIFRFIKAYVIKTGFLSGYTGLFISYHMSKEVFLKYYLAYKIRSQKHHSTH